MHWRRWLIDVPARLLDIAVTGYGLYLVAVITATAIIAPLMVATILLLWFGFGIRWGW